MKTIHLIFSAHLDPVWLWQWQSGLDEALATFRSACERLETHPDLTFSHGEAWVYQQVERVDKKLFERIRKLVRENRWEIVGGWWMQPDCNLPSGFAMEKQIALGQAYFADRFGFSPKVGLNVDSFGHAATLPRYMHAAGQKYYVMMRPQEHERQLPARLFNWQGYEGDPQVLTFRIAGHYGQGSDEARLNHLEKALTELPAGVEHTMCFMGLGDHGGGPTENLIRWCREHWNDIPDCKLLFSTPSRFFQAIEAEREKLPRVTGELQMHAVGCYSVYRPIKTSVRRAEHRLHQAEILCEKYPEAREAATPESLQEAWRKVCFNHFHDALGGTCTPSAYVPLLDQLGFANAVADDLLQTGLRKAAYRLSDDPLQRMVFCNASDCGYSGYVEAEVWLGHPPKEKTFRLLDEAGIEVAYQRMANEALACFGWTLPHLLLRLDAKPGELRAVRVEQGVQPAAMPPLVRAEGATIASCAGVTVDLARRMLRFPGGTLPLPGPVLVEDQSDTWSHDADRYSEQVLCAPEWEQPRVVDRGPLLASLRQEGRIGASALRAEWRVYANEMMVELLLCVDWREKQRVLKLVVQPPSPATGRTDGIMGGDLVRPLDGQEKPMRDWSLLQLANNARLGIVAPDVFAVDSTAERIRLTLLRSPLMAHHIPFQDAAPRGTYSDQGPNDFRFRFMLNGDLSTQWLEAQALMLQRPLLYADVTRGMPPKLPRNSL